MRFTLLDLTKEFSFKVVGNVNLLIDNLSSNKMMNKNSLGWAKNHNILSSFSSGAIICSVKDFKKIKQNQKVTYLISQENPRLIFSKIANHYFSSRKVDSHTNYYETHKQNNKIKIGQNAFIGENVSIGENTLIYHNVVIYPNTIIGDNCIIYSNTTIGTEGLGLTLDSHSNLYFKFPQLGGVIIESFVEIGPGSTIRRGALENTIISEGTKIGSLCNVGHNSLIGKNCILTCNVVTSGSSTIGDSVFMGVGSVVKQGLKVGKNSIIGQGAVITKNVPSNQTWVGNPATSILK